ncbi:molybdopterin molybdotransferase [Bosea sp. CRIB-10]|uniref:molybdopterin molybdotransferase MoeA n=1 Tax=Bosea sp. CRIB-10 TaxID=378404 RepID=UPI0008EC75BF|nr:gephyrin-like molybdotransferase Glp [Bosea sp. CRIB-10]SFD31883.1 molybdopterin molybdotransferase [Bosea sp. CRIB-10]
MTITIASRAPEQDMGRQKALLPVPDACRRAASYATPLRAAETVSVFEALGRTLAAPVAAELAMPPFSQSAMDGYALAAGDGIHSGARLEVVERIAAGSVGKRLGQGKASRLFTGAPLPEGADAVIMQEHVEREGSAIILRRPIRAGDNVRYRGEDIEPFEPLFGTGERLDARHIALLAAQGIARVGVLVRARVAVISTGDELRQAGAGLGAAAIYDSNRPMLLALIAQAGLIAIDGGWVPDDAERLAARMRELAGRVDLVLTSGGASAGEEDHALSALDRAGGRGETLKIALKPGKPAVVGAIGAAAYLGLPGNPVSSLVSWLILGHAMVSALEGRAPRQRLGCPMTSRSHFDRRPGRAEFAPARLSEDGGVEILGRGGSARLRPLVQADGLAEIATDNAGVLPGDTVLFHPFRDGFVV